MDQQIPQKMFQLIIGRKNFDILHHKQPISTIERIQLKQTLKSRMGYDVTEF